VPESQDNQLKQAADTIKATVEAIQAIGDLIEDAERSVIIEVNNTSSRTLDLTHSSSVSGGFSGGVLPPDSIGPLSTHLFAHTSSGFLQGSAGRVIFRINDDALGVGGDGIAVPNTLFMRWDNPFVGRNTFVASAQTGQDTLDWYVIRSFTGDGNEAAHMRAIFGERADFGISQSDWTTCGECKALFFALDESISKCPSNAINLGIEDQQGHALFRFGKHKVAGTPFRLTQSIPGPNRSPLWRKCTNCKALFYNGFAKKGVCVGQPFVGGVQNIHNGHVAEGPDLQLVFDTPLRPGQQHQWRWCDKCFELFFLPHNADAECAAGGQHHTNERNYLLNLA
jgi:hypothetical protein